MSDFIRLEADGRKKQVSAAAASTGAADQNRLVKTGPDGRIDSTLLPTGIGDESKGVEASEALNAGDFVNIFDLGGASRVRRANATAAGSEAVGFVLDNFAAGEQATVFFEGENTALTGLTAGQTLFLSADTPGGVTTTPPSAVGNIVQIVGKACDATSAIFKEDDGVCIGA